MSGIAAKQSRVTSSTTFSKEPLSAIGSSQMANDAPSAGELVMHEPQVCEAKSYRHALPDQWRFDGSNQCALARAAIRIGPMCQGPCGVLCVYAPLTFLRVRAGGCG